MITDSAQATALVHVSRAQDALGRAEQQAVAARAALHDSIRYARRIGVRQVDLTACTGYTREHIRRVCRDAPGGG